MLLWLFILATINLAQFQSLEDNPYQTAYKILDKYATSIRNGDLFTILARNFTMRHCNWSIVLSPYEVFHRLTDVVDKVPTRSFRIVGVTSSNGIVSRFSAQILPYMSVNNYEVQWNGTYKITSELHNDCKILPLSTSLINDDQLAMDLARNFYNSSEQELWERYGHVEPVQMDEIFHFSIRINSEIRNFRAKYFEQDGKFLVEDRDKEDFHHIEPKNLIMLYRIAEYTGSKSVFDEVFAENITLVSCENVTHYQYYSKDEFYQKVMSHPWYSFNEKSAEIGGIRKFSNKTMTFLLTVNDNCDKKIFVDKDSKIFSEYHISCNLKKMSMIWQNMKQLRLRANLSLLAEDLLSKFYEAVRNRDEERLKSIVDEKFEIRNSTRSTIYTYNSTDIFDQYPSNFTGLRVIGVHQWDNGTMYFRTMGPGVQNYYQTVLKDGNHYVEYERRDEPIHGTRFSLEYFNWRVERDE